MTFTANSVYLIADYDSCFEYLSDYSACSLAYRFLTHWLESSSNQEDEAIDYKDIYSLCDKTMAVYYRGLKERKSAKLAFADYMQALLDTIKTQFSLAMYQGFKSVLSTEMTIYAPSTFLELTSKRHTEPSFTHIGALYKRRTARPPSHLVDACAHFKIRSLIKESIISGLQQKLARYQKKQLLPGSSRFLPPFDKVLAQEHHNGQCFKAFPQIAKKLGLTYPITKDMLSGQSHHSFLLNHAEAEDVLLSERPHSKVEMLLKQIELVSQDRTQCHTLVMCDDRSDILEDIKDYFTRYPEALPSHLRLELIHLDAFQIEVDVINASKVRPVSDIYAKVHKAINTPYCVIQGHTPTVVEKAISSMLSSLMHYGSSALQMGLSLLESVPSYEVTEHQALEELNIFPTSMPS